MIRRDTRTPTGRLTSIPEPDVRPHLEDFYRAVGNPVAMTGPDWMRKFDAREQDV